MAGVVGAQHVEDRRGAGHGEMLPYRSAPVSRTTTEPVVSVVIVNWNAGDALTRCLRSLHQHPPSVPWDLVLVDNASGDASATAAAAEFPGVRLIANDANLGLPAANNQGFAATRGRFVLVSNPDVLYGPGAVDALVDLLERRPAAAIAVPRMRYEDGTLHTSAGDLPTLREALLGRQAQRRAGGGPRGFWWDGWEHDEERRIGRGHEASYLVRRSAIDEVGPQDERYTLDWEGIDWQSRMADAGWEVWFTPAAEVVHLGGASIRQVPARWIVRSHRGMYRYFAQRHRAWRPWLAPLVAGRAAVKLVALVARRDVYEAGHRGGLDSTAGRDGAPRVLHVIEAVEGGTARHVVDVVRWVQGWEHHVAVPSRRRGAPTDETALPKLRELGAHVHVVEMARNPLAPVNAGALLQIRRLIRRTRPDVVHGHSSIGGALARAAVVPGRVPVVYTPNGLAPGRLARLVERGLGRITDRFVAVSDSEADEVRAWRLVDDARLVVIPNGIDVTAPAAGGDLRRLAGVPQGAPVVGTVARLTPQKAPEVFVAAAARILAARRDVHIILVGDGTGRPVLEAALETARRSVPDLDARFHHLAAVDDAGASMGQFDVFVLTSRYEGAPYTTLEAMRAGVPVVLTDVVGNRDAIVPGESGELVPADDPDAVARAVLVLLGDPARSAALGAAGRDRMRRRFSSAAMASALDRVYREVRARDLSGRRSRTGAQPHRTTEQGDPAPERT